MFFLNTWTLENFLTPDPLIHLSLTTALEYPQCEYYNMPYFADSCNASFYFHKRNSKENKNVYCFCLSQSIIFWVHRFVVYFCWEWNLNWIELVCQIAGNNWQAWFNSELNSVLDSTANVFIQRATCAVYCLFYGNCMKQEERKWNNKNPCNSFQLLKVLKIFAFGILFDSKHLMKWIQNKLAFLKKGWKQNGII